MPIEEASPPDRLARAAAARLAEAVALVSGSREAGRRDRARQLVDEAIDAASRARGGADGAAARRALSTLAEAHAARAEDALHGAGQLSLGSQRAPTPEACDEGWARVASIALVAEASAREAAAAAASVEGEGAPAARARAAAARAEAAARAARRLVEDRNDAYTFHARPDFSFGEGWYLAAAGVLAGVAIQVDPEARFAAQATRFLREAGLADRLAPHRPRPRANKATTVLVARAFRADPPGAQRRIRAAFLGDGPVAAPVRAFVDARLASAPPGPKVLVWVRVATHHPGRNTRADDLVAIARLAAAEGLVPVLVGDALAGPAPEGAVDLTLFWRDPLFLGEDGRRAQLGFFEHLRAAHGLVGQVGVTTAGMDGPALCGLPTMYLTDAPNPRMGAWVGAVPGYVEVVRDGDWLARVAEGFAAWRRAAAATLGRP